MMIDGKSAMNEPRSDARVSDLVDGFLDGHLYREPIERIQGLVGAIFVLVSVLWLPTIYLLDSGLR